MGLLTRVMIVIAIVTSLKVHGTMVRETKQHAGDGEDHAACLL